MMKKKTDGILWKINIIITTAVSKRNTKYVYIQNELSNNIYKLSKNWMFIQNK